MHERADWGNPEEIALTCASTQALCGSGILAGAVDIVSLKAE